MARGPSGRIVIEVGAALKDEIYCALEIEGFSMKQWFQRQATALISRAKQPELPLANGDSPKKEAK
jgi:hypothetical protein